MMNDALKQINASMVKLNVELMIHGINDVLTHFVTYVYKINIYSQ